MIWFLRSRIVPENPCHFAWSFAAAGTRCMLVIDDVFAFTGPALTRQARQGYRQSARRDRAAAAARAAAGVRQSPACDRRSADLHRRGGGAVDPAGSGPRSAL